MKKTYQDLPPQEETELVLWLTFFKDSVRNAQTQMKRWKHSGSFWDLEMFFLAVVWADHAARGLECFLSADADGHVWDILGKFRDKVKEHNLWDLRNDLVHREKLFKLQDKKRNPLPPSPMLMLSVYSADNDEYSFGIHKIRLSEVFGLIDITTQDLKRLFESRLAEFYSTGSLPGMIPFTYLRSFAGDHSDE
jgi:hypothetical protein